MGDVRELVFRGDDKTRLYACSDCGKAYSPTIYACRDDLAHEAAKRAAMDCCAPRHCTICGVEVEQPWTACRPCRERNSLQKCAIIHRAEWTDPVQHDGMAGEWGEGYSSSVNALLEAWADEHWVKIGPQHPPPAYCWPCKPSKFEIDPERALESALEEMHEDACDQIVDADEFYDFIEAWNAKQTIITWYPDHSRVIVLDQVRFEHLISGSEARNG